jgi:hypothetical protein
LAMELQIHSSATHVWFDMIWMGKFESNGWFGNLICWCIDLTRFQNKGLSSLGKWVQKGSGISGQNTKENSQHFYFYFVT